jgi:hypothetical protein
MIGRSRDLRQFAAPPAPAAPISLRIVVNLRSDGIPHSLRVRIGQSPSSPAPLASAHTSVRSQATEGVTSDNALRIGQGCAVAGRRADTCRRAERGVPHADTLRQRVRRLRRRARHADRAGHAGGLARAIDDTSVFMSHEQKSDALGNSIGFAAYDGSLSADLDGRIPFEFAAPRFVASSCASRLLVKVAVADVCSVAAGDTARRGQGQPVDSRQRLAVRDERQSRGVEGSGRPPR